ncbi:MAG: hypothetical protein RMK30_02370 [Anaerolineae bacterium]|nr:DUF4062 domain-containing protein [Anaerolineae bacterium]MDW8101706.1 hypothetical protein [Anaerolineae bacterium]
MGKKIRLFISSSRELEGEREIVGQVVAELPVSRGWEIRHTAHAGETLASLREAIEKADLYLIILGRDASAPIGSEWEFARQMKKPTLAYRKDVNYSPSAQYFLRISKVEWRAFKDLEEFRKDLAKAIAQELLDLKNRYGLLPEDVEKLIQFLEEIEKREKGPSLKGHGAGESGVILGR